MKTDEERDSGERWRIGAQRMERTVRREGT
jgi:hypothetical protein